MIEKAATVGAITGLGSTIAGSLAYSKITGKAAGAPGSLAHVLTNDKLDKNSKIKVINEANKEFVKDTLKFTGLAGMAAGVTAIVTGCSNKVSDLAQKGISKTGELLSKVAVNGNDLKTIIKDTSIFKKLNTLPTPAKAAIAVGAGILALALPILNTITAEKAGYIEGKHEKQPTTGFNINPKYK